MISNKWMIYGANGFSGSLAVDEACKRGLTPTLAGRSQSIRDLAKSKNCDNSVFT